MLNNTTIGFLNWISEYDWSVIFLSQKQESFLKPLVDQYAKEGKDKKVVFEANFSKPNCKPKWFFRKDVSVLSEIIITNYIFFYFREIIKPLNETFYITYFINRKTEVEVRSWINLFAFFAGIILIGKIQIQERGRLLSAHHLWA